MMNSNYLMHYGRSKKNGAPGPGSGRYPLGSGKNGQRGYGSPSMASLSNDDLRDRIQRLNLEEQYANLVSRQQMRDAPVGKKVGMYILDKIGNRVLGEAIDYGIFQGKKALGINTKFDIAKYKDADVSSMDSDTIKNVSQWYQNAAVISKLRGPQG